MSHLQKDRIDLCLKRGNRVADQSFVTYTLKDLKRLFDKLGLKHPTKDNAHKHNYCEILGQYRDSHPDISVHFYKWTLDEKQQPHQMHQVGQSGQVEDAAGIDFGVEIKDLESALSVKNKLIKTLSATSKRVHELELQLSKKDSEIQSLRDAQNAGETSSLKSTAEITRLENRIETLSHDILQLQSERDIMKGKITDQSNEYIVLLNQLDQRRKNLDECAGNLEGEKTQLAQCQVQKHQLHEQTINIKEIKAQLEAKTQELLRKGDAMDALLKRIEELTMLVDSHRHQSETVSKLERETAHLNAELDELMQRYDQALSQIDNLDEEQETCLQRNNALKNDYFDLKKRYDEDHADLLQYQDNDLV